MQRERVKEEAALWVVRLSESVDPREQAAFEAWRAQSVEHEIAYEREAAAWERLDRAAALRDPSFAVGGERLSALLTPPRPRRSARRIAAIAATLLIAATAGGAVWFSLSPSQAYATAVGEHRLVRLSDGSTIELNTDTQVVVHYRHGARSVELVHGEALFHVVRDGRPFAVTTAAGRVETRAADVTVRVRDDRTEATVKDGTAIAVGPVAGESAALGADAEVVLSDGVATVQAVSSDEIDRQLAWRQGAIALNGQTLAEAAAEFNRYNVRKITVADRATGTLRVGGYFRTADVDGFVAAVTRTFPVDAASQDGGEIRLAKKAEKAG